MNITLYDYYRSSASYRVRIALHLKGIEHQSHYISLLDGEQGSDEYLKINPAGLVPSITTNQGPLSQSIAIIEYLDELHPEIPLLPPDIWQRAQCRSMALTLACDIHPLNNLRVLNYLNSELGVNQNEKMVWYHYWLEQGFNTLETLLRQKKESTAFCCGDQPTLADICLVPQVYNAKRFNFDLGHYPNINTITENCNRLNAFDVSKPD